MAILVCFQNDLRLADNAALSWALSTQETHPQPVYLIAITPNANDQSANAWWQTRSLLHLQAQINAKGGCLHYLQADQVNEFIGSHNITDIAFNQSMSSQQQESLFVEAQTHDIRIHSFNASGLIHGCDLFLDAQQRPFTNFASFQRASLKKLEALSLPWGEANTLTTARSHHEAWLTPIKCVRSERFNDFNWQPGEVFSQKRLSKFLADEVFSYAKDSEFPARESTSFLSAALRFGELSARQVYWAAKQVGACSEVFLQQLLWREYAHYLLVHFPNMTTKNFHSMFDRFPWDQRKDATFTAWCDGKTGIPLIDAGMKELKATGFMHHRVRLIVASYLVKNLNKDWRLGYAFFKEHLIDADEALNACAWQDVAGCGIDAAPYFRVINPILQGQKFDPQGTYINRWTNNQDLEKPWMPKGFMLVDLEQSRLLALKHYQSIK